MSKDSSRAAISTRFMRVFFMASLFVGSAMPADAQIDYKDDSSLITNNIWFVGAGAGAGWGKLPDSYTTVSNGAPDSPPYNQDLYTINNPSFSLMLQFNAGYRWQHDNAYVPFSSLYVQYRHYNDGNVTGRIYQYSLPDFLNYNYQMSYMADLVTVNGKLDLGQNKRVMPYIAGGVGAIINRVEDYKENQTANVTPRISPGFASTSSTHFAATLGVGVDIILTRNVWMTLGYDHVFQTSLPNASGVNAWTGTSLRLGDVRLDTVFLNISARFPDTFRLNS